MSDIKNQFNSSTFINTTFKYGGQEISKALGAIPAIPNLFIGRGNSTADIHQRLTTKSNLLLLINGKGGIGKTTIASQYYFEYANYYAHLIWLVSEKGIKEAVISLALSLKISFPDHLGPTQQVNEILRQLSALKRPVLLVIDNANDINDLDDNFQLLRQFHHIDILITSRIDHYENLETYPVKHLDKESANDLFKHHFKAFQAEEQALLDKLLVAIGYNTLVIELLAKNLNEFNTDFKDHYPLQKLLEDIQEKGVLAISRSTKVAADYQLQKAKPEDIIKTMYDISELSKVEKQVLSIFAVLPATSITFEDLELCLPKLETLDSVLLKLSQKGWVDYDQAFKSFKTNPIISEIVSVQNRDRLAEDTLSLLYLLINKLDYEEGVGHIKGDFNEIKKNVSFAETFVNNFAVMHDKKSVLLERLGNFYTTYGNLEKALKFFVDYLKLAKALHISHPNNIDLKNGLAIAYSKLGETHTSLGNLEKALTFFEDQTELFEALHKDYPNHVGFKNGLAVAYSKLGRTHTLLGNLEKALTFFEDYLRLKKELHISDPNNINFNSGLAIAYERLGETHSSLGNLEKALTFFEAETELFEKLNASHPDNLSFKNGLAVAYAKLGKTHIMLDNLDKALLFFEERLKIAKALHTSYPNNIGFKHNLAIAYANLGSTHTLLGNLAKALTFFEEDLKLTKVLHASHPNNVNFKDGLAISYEKLGKIHAALGNLDKALLFFEEGLKIGKELHTSHPNNVDFKHGLAIAYVKLGVLLIEQLKDKEKGMNLLSKASTILEALVDKHPEYDAFRKNHKWVVEEIERVG